VGEVDQERRLAALVGSRADELRSAATCRQVHGSVVHRVERVDGSVTRLGEGDALVTTISGVGVLVWTADCVPVLLAGDGVVAAVHSGWRGCAADVLGAAVVEISRTAGVEPGGLRVVLGPAVCGDCYRVGPEVIDSLATFDLDPAWWLRGDRVDLRGFLTARAEALGVPIDRIETVGGCTVESPVLASYRRDGVAAGRQWAMAFLNSQ
jgi:YfiH family protein